MSPHTSFTFFCFFVFIAHLPFSFFLLPSSFFLLPSSSSFSSDYNISPGGSTIKRCKELTGVDKVVVDPDAGIVRISGR